jgi:hypothetical protein
MAKRMTSGSMAIVILVVGWLATWPDRLEAQSTSIPVQADNSAYLTHPSGTNLGGSVALVDASTVYTSDICVAINTLITGTYNSGKSNGVVVDARGINVSPNSSLTCANSPFAGVTHVPSKFSITILLPASTIAIQKTWQLPSYARLVGEGAPTFAEWTVQAPPIAKAWGSSI